MFCVREMRAVFTPHPSDMEENVTDNGSMHQIVIGLAAVDFKYWQVVSRDFTYLIVAFGSRQANMLAAAVASCFNLSTEPAAFEDCRRTVQWIVAPYSSFTGCISSRMCLSMDNKILSCLRVTRFPANAVLLTSSLPQGILSVYVDSTGGAAVLF